MTRDHRNGVTAIRLEEVTPERRESKRNKVVVEIFGKSQNEWNEKLVRSLHLGWLKNRITTNPLKNVQGKRPLSLRGKEPSAILHVVVDNGKQT